MIFKGHESIIYSMDVSQSGKTLFSADSMGKIFRWDVTSGGGALFIEVKKSIYKVMIG